MNQENEIQTVAIIIPLFLQHGNNINYLFMEENHSLVFPKETPLSGEAPENAAKRALSNLNLQVQMIKFMYLMQHKKNKILVYMSLVDGSTNNLVKLTGDQLLKKIRENDIYDVETLSALSSVLLQSKEANKYLLKDMEDKV